MNKILDLRAAGKSYAEISKELGVSKSTVSYHVSENGKLLASNRRKNRKRKIKQKAIEYKGGKCSLCGYSRCQAALEFHHLDPAAKDFAFTNGLNSNGHGFDKMKYELDKCALLCSNCHREVHSGLVIL